MIMGRIVRDRSEKNAWLAEAESKDRPLLSNWGRYLFPFFDRVNSFGVAEKNSSPSSLSAEIDQNIRGDRSTGLGRGRRPRGGGTAWCKSWPPVWWPEAPQPRIFYLTTLGKCVSQDAEGGERETMGEMQPNLKPNLK